MCAVKIGYYAVLAFSYSCDSELFGAAIFRHLLVNLEEDRIVIYIQVT